MTSLDLLVGESAVQWQRQDPGRKSVRLRQRPSLSKRAVPRERMNRRVVDARLDPSLFQRRPDSIPIDLFWQHDHGEMVRRDPPAVAVSKRHREPLDAVQGLAVEAGDPRPGLVLLDQARKLDEPNRCADLVEPIVEPGKNDVIARRRGPGGGPR